MSRVRIITKEWKPNQILFFIITIIVIISSMYSPKAFAQSSEDTVQAAWIYQLVPYFRWKERNTNKVTICTIGIDRVGTLLKNSNKKKNLKIKIRPDPDEYSSCHLMYISNSEAIHVEEILFSVRKHSILTLSGIKGFAKLGGMVQFVIQDSGTIELKINKTVVKKSGIIVDSDLLGIADVVS